MSAGTHRKLKCPVNKDGPPIIFIHYGNSAYLPAVFEIARLTNSDTPIVILGDAENAHYESGGILHERYEKLAYGPELETFDRVFQFIAGDKHGRKSWVEFVFKRWFYINNYIKRCMIDGFWTFDTDTLLLANLHGKHKRFQSYDCTEQCHGKCMNGYIANQNIVQQYVNTINELFQDTDYLEVIKAHMQSHPHHAYTEMAAFVAFKHRKLVRSIQLSTIMDGETFDDCICDHDDMERQGASKKLYFQSGGVYVRHVPTMRFVRLNSVNMSRTTGEFKMKLAEHVRQGYYAGKDAVEHEFWYEHPVERRMPKDIYRRLVNHIRTSASGGV